MNLTVTLSEAKGTRSEVHSRVGLSFHGTNPLLEQMRVPGAPWSREDRQFPQVPCSSHARARSPTVLGTACPRGACWLATTHLHGDGDGSVRPRQSSSSRVPGLCALAFTPGTVRSVGLCRTCPEPCGIVPDQGFGGKHPVPPPHRQVDPSPLDHQAGKSLHSLLKTSTLKHSMSSSNITGPSRLKGRKLCEFKSVFTPQRFLL